MSDATWNYSINYRSKVYDSEVETRNLKRSASVFLTISAILLVYHVRSAVIRHGLDGTM